MALGSRVSEVEAWSAATIGQKSWLLAPASRYRARADILQLLKLYLRIEA
jgi:hypothetical protein